VGLFPSAEYKRGTVALKPGDVLITCTDGILEACNAEEDEFGKERLAACVIENRQKNAQGIVDAVLFQVNKFAVGGKYTDDKVLMIMKVTDEGLLEAAKKRPLNRPIELERRETPRGDA
jgi:sigma-B regulation protein RsbU (phosphoserine phosphatase)